MIDREKVIKVLNHFTEERICLPNLIPWVEIAEAVELLKEQEYKDRMFHALEEDWKRVVKEQEAVKPIFMENPYTHLPASYCPKCREPINQFIVGNPYREVKYCHYCGQKLKWAES